MEKNSVYRNDYPCLPATASGAPCHPCRRDATLAFPGDLSVIALRARPSPVEASNQVARNLFEVVQLNSCEVSRHSLEWNANTFGYDA